MCNIMNPISIYGNVLHGFKVHKKIMYDMKI